MTVLGFTQAEKRNVSFILVSCIVVVFFVIKILGFFIYKLWGQTYASVLQSGMEDK